MLWYRARWSHLIQDVAHLNTHFRQLQDCTIAPYSSLIVSEGRKINSWGKRGCSCPRVFLLHCRDSWSFEMVFFLHKWSSCTFIIPQFLTTWLLLAWFQQWHSKCAITTATLLRPIHSSNLLCSLKQLDFFLSGGCKFESWRCHGHLWSKRIQESKTGQALKEGSVTYFLQSQQHLPVIGIYELMNAEGDGKHFPPRVLCQDPTTQYFPLSQWSPYHIRQS